MSSILISVAFCCVLAVVARLVKSGRVRPFIDARFTRQRAVPDTCYMKLRKRLALTQQHTLHAIEVQGRTLILATHPGGVCVVDPTAPGRTNSAEGLSMAGAADGAIQPSLSFQTSPAGDSLQ